MSAGDWLAAIFTLAWVAAELTVPEVMGTRRPAARPGAGGRMAERPPVPSQPRGPLDRW